MITVEAYPSSIFEVPVGLADHEGKPISEDRFRVNPADVITYRLYTDITRYFSQKGSTSSYVRNGITGTRVDFVNSSSYFTLEDVGQDFEPQVSVYRNSVLLTDNDLQTVPLKISIRLPARLTIKDIRRSVGVLSTVYLEPIVSPYTFAGLVAVITNPYGAVTEVEARAAALNRVVDTSAADTVVVYFGMAFDVAGEWSVTFFGIDGTTRTRITDPYTFWVE